jgi:TP901 family phage tail tape measure protein
MKASIVIELLTKGLDKARSTEKAIKQIGRAADGAEREASGLARAEARIGDAGNRAAAGQNRFAASIHKSSNEMRRAKTEAQAFERQMDRLGRQRARMPHGNTSGLGGMGAVSGVGMAFLGGLGLGVGGVAGAGYVAKATLDKSGEIEFARDQLQVLGEYSDEQAALYDKILKPAGIDRGVGTIGAYGVFGNLMAGGLDAGNAAKMTDDVMVFAKATQSATDDAAKTTVALQNNMKIGATQMMAAFDSMALAGKEGQFEVRDMARSAPSIFARMGKLGETGLQGVRGFAAMAQAIRTTAGTSDEAATNFENMLDKFTSKEFIDNAAEMGVNVQETFATANKQGLSPVLELLKKIKSASGGDAFKLKELMPDVQANAALSALIDKIPELATAIERYGNSAGTVAKDFTTATGNMQTAWDRMAGSIGDKATSLADKILPSITKAMEGVTTSLEGKDAMSVGYSKTAEYGTPLEKNQRSEFKKRWDKLNPDKGPEGFEADYIAAIRAVGEGRAKTAFDRLDQQEQTPKLERFYRQGYVPGKGPEGLGAAPSTGKMPTPAERPDPTVKVQANAYSFGTGREKVADATATLAAVRAQALADHKAIVDSYQAYGASRISGNNRATANEDGSISARPHQRAQLQDSDDGSVSLRPEQRQAFAIPPLDGDPLAEGMREGGQKAEMAAKATSAAIEATLSAIPLFGAGLKAGMQFADGLTASAGAVAAAANAALVAPVANRVPQSPAKIGPLRNLPSMGSKIAEQLAGGIDRATAPADATERLVGGIADKAKGVKHVVPSFATLKRDNPVDGARRLASLISERPKEVQTQRQATGATAKGKPVSVTIGSIVFHGVKDAAAGVGKIGVMLERQLAGTVGDVGAG